MLRRQWCRLLWRLRPHPWPQRPPARWHRRPWGPSRLWRRRLTRWQRRQGQSRCEARRIGVSAAVYATPALFQSTHAVRPVSYSTPRVPRRALIQIDLSSAELVGELRCCCFISLLIVVHAQLAPALQPGRRASASRPTQELDGWASSRRARHALRPRRVQLQLAVPLHARPLPVLRRRRQRHVRRRRDVARHRLSGAPPALLRRAAEGPA